MRIAIGEWIMDAIVEKAAAVIQLHPDDDVVIARAAIPAGTVLDELERRKLRRGLITMCAAGGMAPAIIIERV